MLQLALFMTNCHRSTALAAKQLVLGVNTAASRGLVVLAACLLVAASGCWAPFRSYGIPARTLPNSFRTPMRTAGAPLNFSNLTVQPPADYILGPNDILEVTIPGLFDGAEVRPLRVQVMASGEVNLPLVGPVPVGSKNLLQAQQEITDAYSSDFLVNPRVSVALAEKSSTSILVLGKVKVPGVHILPKFENDVGHALGAAGGLLEDSADVIEVHRRIPAANQRNSTHSPSMQGASTQGAASLPADQSVQLARFVEASSGVSYWVPDDATSIDGDTPAIVGDRVKELGTNGDLTPSTTPVATSRPGGQPLEPRQPDFVISQNTESRRSPSLFGQPTPVGRQSWDNGPQFSVSTSAPAFNVARQELPAITTRPIATTSPLDPMRRVAVVPATLPEEQSAPEPLQSFQPDASYLQGQIQGDRQILRIPLRQFGPNRLSRSDVSLQPGDVVVVPSRRHEVFYVVGKLNPVNTVRFTVGDRERELGVGFILPRDREIDVVTAVVMAGYIDPIDSPTTVTVHRRGPDGCPLLIHVDLIKARYDACETVLVQAGDIIYLNPDSCWWWRRTFDRIVPSLIIEPYKKLLGFNR